MNKQFEKDYHAKALQRIGLGYVDAKHYEKIILNLEEENKKQKAQLAQIRDICFKWNEYPSNFTGDEAMYEIEEVLKGE